MVAWRFATRYAEIVDGRRAAAHLGPLSEPAAVSRLSADALRAREHLRALTHPARPGGGRAGARPHGRGDAVAVALSGVRVQLVQPRVAEAVALLRLRGVVRALAFRLDHRPEGWRVTAAELVGAGSGHAAQG
ncbi:MAG TPA: Rv3235 family protein [Pilimelia sp.]|nr:Rv3235 family protein [Pilimelia sp.]